MLISRRRRRIVLLHVSSSSLIEKESIHQRADKRRVFAPLLLYHGQDKASVIAKFDREKPIASRGRMIASGCCSPNQIRFTLLDLVDLYARGSTVEALNDGDSTSRCVDNRSEVPLRRETSPLTPVSDMQGATGSV